MINDEKVKRNFTYRSGRPPKRRNSPTFMEFVHRQEERRESHEQEMKKAYPHDKSAERPVDTRITHPSKDTVDIPPVPLFNLADLLLAGMLIFLFITMLLLFMN